MQAKTSDWRPGPTVCRCCFAEGCYKDIATEYFWMGKREVYSEMLEETFDLSIAYSQSGGPNSNSRLICEPCIARLRDASDFKRQVQECEKIFLQQLDSGKLSETDIIEIGPFGSDEKEVKLEKVKQEKRVSDDEENDDLFARNAMDFGLDDDDDDDDLDDQPLMNLANKIPKKESLESVDLLDLLDNAKAGEKRKSSSKSKASPSKKAKTKKEAKATSSKVSKTEKKKKEVDSSRRNAELIVKYTTAYPFRLPESNMVCVFCWDSFESAISFRDHMRLEHQTFKLRLAFAHCGEGLLKADCTELQCRVCNKNYDNLDDIARHIYMEHSVQIDFSVDLGLQPFILQNDILRCALCNYKTIGLRELSRHTYTHFLKHICETCGKAYATNSSLKHHLVFSHSGKDYICVRCKMSFDTLQERRDHLNNSKACWRHSCNVCAQRFVSWNVKQQHLTAVHGLVKKPFKCPECSEMYETRKKLSAHFRLAHTDNNYVCSFCGHKFSSKREHAEHTVIHTKEKSYPCTVCSKAFSRKKNLAQHLWIHSERKRFECKICNKKFNQRVCWKSHMRNHHQELVDFEAERDKSLNFYSVLKKI